MVQTSQKRQQILRTLSSPTGPAKGNGQRASVGTIKLVTGEVEIIDALAADTQRQPAKAGMVVNKANALQTGPNVSAVVIKLNTGADLLLAENSFLAFLP